MNDPQIELLPADLDEEYTEEQMEEAEAEAREIIERYYSDIGQEEKRL